MADCAKSQGLETRGTRCSLLFAPGYRPVGQPTTALHCGGVSGPNGDQGYTTYHCPPPRPGTSPPAYSLQPCGQRWRNNLRPQRPLPFGAALQAIDRPLRLYFASGKEQVKEYRLREPDKTKYEIYHALCDVVPRCRNWEQLPAALHRKGVTTEFRMRGGTSDVQGVVFAKNDYMFNGSKIDRQFSYSKIDTALERNSRQALASERQSAPILTPSFSYLLNDLLRPKFDPDEAEQTQQKQQRRRRGRRR